MVVEGPGPDFCYSYVTFLYAFRHRIGRGESALDKPLLRSLDWLSTMHDSQGLPMQAISTRTGRFSPNSLAYLLGALEYYARERPYCTTLAEDYLAVLERQSGSVAIDHGGIPWITAALFHDPSIVLTPLPDRLARFADYGNYDITSYFNVRRDYHTLLVFSGVKDWSGLQHWCLAGERPLLCEFEGGGASGLRTWAIDTARLNIENRFSMDRSDLQTALHRLGRRNDLLRVRRVSHVDRQCRPRPKAGGPLGHEPGDLRPPRPLTATSSRRKASVLGWRWGR